MSQSQGRGVKGDWHTSISSRNQSAQVMMNCCTFGDTSLETTMLSESSQVTRTNAPSRRLLTNPPRHVQGKHFTMATLLGLDSCRCHMC